jgi:hypothetical protein
MNKHGYNNSNSSIMDISVEIKLLERDYYESTVKKIFRYFFILKLYIFDGHCTMKILPLFNSDITQHNSIYLALMTSQNCNQSTLN